MGFRVGVGGANLAQKTEADLLGALRHLLVVPRLLVPCVCPPAIKSLSPISLLQSSSLVAGTQRFVAVCL